VCVCVCVCSRMDICHDMWMPLPTRLPCVCERDKERVCACERKRERENECERESVCALMCACSSIKVCHDIWMPYTSRNTHLRVYVRETERESACARESERESVCARVCVCVCAAASKYVTTFGCRTLATSLTCVCSCERDKEEESA